jgi:periplasmic protein TonB
MRAGRLFGAAVAVMLSGGIHLAGSSFLGGEAMELDGGGEAAPARIGASFADMVAGTPGVARPEPAPSVEAEVTEQVRPVADADRAEAARAQPVAPDRVAVVAPAEAAPAIVERMEAVGPVAAERPEPVADAAVAEAEPVSVDTTGHPEPVAAAMAAVTLRALSPSDAPPPAEAAPSVHAVAPSAVTAASPPVAAAAPAAPPETVSAREEGAAPLASPRPPLRPERPRPPPPDPPRQAEQRQAETQPRPPPPAATGNASPEARRGSADGTEAGTATAAAPERQPAREAGTAAEAANYPGQVLRRIARQGRPRVRHDGPDAVITFRIDAGGGLAALGIARSSGNPALDEAGLSIVRGAAPFPRPPAGAQTSFSINFAGR